MTWPWPWWFHDIYSPPSTHKIWYMSLYMTNRRPQTFEKSFASSHRAQFWHPTKNGDLQPRDIALNHSKKVWFLCDCKHEFETTPHGITGRNRWCRYCSNQELCPDNDCKQCHDKSFASSDKAGYWEYSLNQNIKPRDVFLSASSRHFFKCHKCAHVFDAELNYISRGRWCPFCAHKRSCGDDCQVCVNTPHT